jgi:cytidylate kinase
MTPRVIAIDGPAASGKSSTAAAVARAMGFVHIDSGSLYRALTWVSVHHCVAEPAAILELAEALHIGLRPIGSEVTVHIDGLDDIDATIRTGDVNASVSAIAAMPALRDWVDREIRATVDQLPGAVIDGRDIGTVVVPDAALKIFLTAAAPARAGRRLAQGGAPVDPQRIDAEAAVLPERDRRDASRAVAPLREPPDAVRIDSTGLAFAEQVDQIVALARARGL